MKILSRATACFSQSSSLPTMIALNNGAHAGHVVAGGLTTLQATLDRLRRGRPAARRGHRDVDADTAGRGVLDGLEPGLRREDLHDDVVGEVVGTPPAWSASALASR